VIARAVRSVNTIRGHHIQKTIAFNQKLKRLLVAFLGNDSSVDVGISLEGRKKEETPNVIAGIRERSLTDAQQARTLTTTFGSCLLSC
jgi:hypothetical protein